MSAFIFNGLQVALAKENQLAARVKALPAVGKPTPSIAAILFSQDSGSRLYTQLKKEAAERVGIAYQVHEFSLLDSSQRVVEKLQQLTADPTITGIIIQKPWRSTWAEITRVGYPPARMTHGPNDDGDQSSLAKDQAKAIGQAFQAWWHYQTSHIGLAKDVDGLHPETLAAITTGIWRERGGVLPATARAVIEILLRSRLPDAHTLDPITTALADIEQLQGQHVIIIGKSDLLGQPLFAVLKQAGVTVSMIGSLELHQRISQGQALLDADVVVSATGRAGLVTGDLLKEGAVVVDVGEPRGDVDRLSVETKAAFLTPVPGGVGPMTVVCLLENAVDLVESRKE